MLFEDFQERLTILAILNLYVASMPPIKFWLSQTYGLGGDAKWILRCYMGMRYGIMCWHLS